MLQGTESHGGAVEMLMCNRGMCRWAVDASQGKGRPVGTNYHHVAMPGCFTQFYTKPKVNLLRLPRDKAEHLSLPPVQSCNGATCTAMLPARDSCPLKFAPSELRGASMASAHPVMPAQCRALMTWNLMQRSGSVAELWCRTYRALILSSCTFM